MGCSGGLGYFRHKQTVSHSFRIEFMQRILRVLGYSSVPQVLQTVVLALTMSRADWSSGRRSEVSPLCTWNEQLEAAGLSRTAKGGGDQRCTPPGPCRAACDASGRADRSITDSEKSQADKPRRTRIESGTGANPLGCPKNWILVMAVPVVRHSWRE